MSTAEPGQPAKTILIAGASRGLGLAMAGEFASRGWRVIGTVRDGGRTALHDVAAEHPDRVRVEALDINAADQIAALRERLAGESLDILFVNAGVSSQERDAPVGRTSTEEFMRVMLTNVLGPMRVIEALEPRVPADGLIGVMSSGLGSITNNTTGGWEAYRASKAALNMLIRSFAAREGERPRAMLAMAPGWIRTDLGGADAPYSVEESTPVLVDLLIDKRGRPGLEYLDRFGQTVPW